MKIKDLTCHNEDPAQPNKQVNYLKKNKKIIWELYSRQLEWTGQQTQSSQSSSDTPAPTLEIPALNFTGQCLFYHTDTDKDAWLSTASLPHNAGEAALLKYRSLDLAQRFWFRRSGIGPEGVFWDAVGWECPRLLWAQDRILTLSPGCLRNFLPEPWDHLGKADDLLDAVTDQVSQVGQHGELGQVQGHRRVIRVFIQIQVGEAGWLRCVWGKKREEKELF